MINKLIRNRVIEIVIALLLVGASIPVWQSFQERYSSADVTKPDEYNLKFKVSNENNVDNLSINNDYYTYKNYKIYLKPSNNIDDNTPITINGVEHTLNDFTKTKYKRKSCYVLVIDSMFGGQKDYYISINNNGKSLKYSYILEEIDTL